jgi:putative tricarboxylic transport membrane protein
MSEAPEKAGRGLSRRSVEICVAMLTGVFGTLVMVGSWQVGIGWGDEGPKSGFFPFYVGLIVLGCSIINLAQVKHTEGMFADWGQLRSVMSVVIPTAIYVTVLPSTILIPFTAVSFSGLGFYVASILLIAGFMKWLGRYSWALTLAVAFSFPAATYVIFEKWFLIPLPKGPFENLLGL